VLAKSSARSSAIRSNEPAREGGGADVLTFIMILTG
jgi:hypothetical protein